MNHERVANWYSISFINWAVEIAERIEKGQFTWEDSGGVHPCWEGSKYYSAAISRLLDMEVDSKAHLQASKPHMMPKPLDAFCYDKGAFMDVRDAQKVKGFSYVTDWIPQTDNKKIELRPGFCHVTMLEATKAGASLKLEFDGKKLVYSALPVQKRVS